jgi:parallel beta-helix repeat protein
MRLTTRILVILSVLAVLGSAFTAGYLMNTARQPQDGQVYPLIRRLPISIYDASEFTPPNSTTGCACVVAGSGSARDPYVIAGWEIDASGADGIIVVSVKEYFVITQVSISGTRQHVAVRLERVENAKVSDSSIAGTFAGISIRQSKNVAVVDNVISETEYGVKLETSDFNTVVGNTLDRMGQVSIFVRGSDNLVKDNTIEQTYGGINVDGTPGRADRNIVENNTIQAAQAYGIGLWQACSNRIASNTITSGQGSGIFITYTSRDNTIDSNDVRHNTGDGISISKGSSNNLVQNNVFTGNGDGVYTFDLHSEASLSNTWTDNTFLTRSSDTLG